MTDKAMRVSIYEWGKAVGSQESLALARRFLDIRSSAVLCLELIERLPTTAGLDEQARVVTQLEVNLVHELADQIAKAKPLFEIVSAQLHARVDHV